ncbi:MAG TPA: N-acylglucosamine 2-epimerase, partial [Alistipes sp.]|nr:N-acylglucosamine 2-epimerase [Alistipes sp.]
MTSEQKTFLQSCREQYLGDLTGDIMPFWLRHGLDREHGGVYTCLDREGRLMDPTKSVWFQGRFGYICAAACNRIERRTEWLAASKSRLDLIERPRLHPH